MKVGYIMCSGDEVPDALRRMGLAVTLLDPTTHLTAGDLRSQLSGILPDAALPKRVVILPAIPLRGPGKPDRAAIRLAAEESS